MSKISNILLMLQYLENGRKYSIKELSEKLEVSERMIRIYKEELEKAGIYIDTIMGPYGGYILKQNVKIPSRKFSIDDYNFLHNLDVKEEDKENLEIITDKVHEIYLKSARLPIELSQDIKRIYNILCKAIKEKRKVKIKYFSYMNGNQERIIKPYEMVLYDTDFACVAFCELRNDIRSFELKRVKEIELL